MPLHQDDPARPGNLTDDEYAAATRALMEQAGDAGLHIIPAEILAAATKQAKASHGE